MTPRPRPSGGSPRLPQHLRRFRRHQPQHLHPLQLLRLLLPLPLPLPLLLLRLLRLRPPLHLPPRPLLPRPPLLRLRPPLHLPPRLLLPRPRLLRLRPPLHLLPRRHRLLPRLLLLHLLPHRHRLPHLRRPTRLRLLPRLPTRLRLLPRLRLLRLRPTQLSQRAVSIRARSNQTARRSAGAAMGRDRLRRRPVRRSRP